MASWSTTTTTSSPDLVALSSDGKILACIPSSSSGTATVATSVLRVLLFQVESGSLQTTLTHRNSNNNRGATESSVVSWNPIKLFFLGNNKNNHLLAVLCPDRVLLWDLNRGVVVHTLSAKSSAIFRDACAAPPPKDKSNNDDEDKDDNLFLYVLLSIADTGKVQIHEYSATTGKMERKVKAGKGGGAHGLGVTADSLVVRHADSLRILSRSDGHKVYNSSLFKNETTTTADRNLAVCCDTRAVTVSNGQLVWMDLTTGHKLPISIPLDKTALSDDHYNSSFRLWLCNERNESSVIVAEGEKIHEISFKEGAKVEKTWSCPMDPSLELQVRVGQRDSVVALLFRNGHFQIAIAHLDRKQDTVRLSWKTASESSRNAQQPQHKGKDSKRKDLPRETVLGPAQAGGEALVSDGPPSKKSKLGNVASDEVTADTIANIQEGLLDYDVDDDDDEDAENDKDNDGKQTLGERLQMLQATLDEQNRAASVDTDDDVVADEPNNNSLAADAGGFYPKRATTESLTKMLDQALHSGERKLVELALAVRDKRILTETCQGLSDDQILRLLNVLTSRMAAKGSRAEHLSVWISVLLKLGRIHSLEHLQPLRNLVEQRVALLPGLLKLQGRLSLVKRPKHKQK